MLASWASSIAVGVAPGQPGGTDSRPSVLAWPIPADTGVPAWPKGAVRRIAVWDTTHRPNRPWCPGPNVVCCPIEAPNCPIPTPKYACSVCFRTVVKLVVVRPRPRPAGRVLAVGVVNQLLQPRERR